ncbi:hypothetical protein [Polaromonas glacialis]|uniref:hypothetical protein n=1 Tax=Polaromonas glacialis TaxID=866564 RepID=UPI000B07E153|nr:hypothetical protein [Polaromonas glacialis]
MPSPEPGAATPQTTQWTPHGCSRPPAVIDVIDMSPGQTTRAARPQGRQVDRPQP